MGIAVVRALPDSYARATRGVLLDPASAGPIDVKRAREQHAAYVAALRSIGLSPTVLPADEGSPDSCFVEDLAVVVGRRALVCRTGHPGRRREAGPVAQALRELGLDARLMSPDDGVLEGGDVLRVGRRLYVGRSDRSDARGAAALARCFPELEVVPIELPPGTLHLKCACSSPAPGLVVLAEGTLDPAIFQDVLVVPGAEAYAANLVGWEGGVLAPVGCPQTERLLEDRGLTVHLVELSEFRKGDGSLTCLSLVVG